MSHEKVKTIQIKNGNVFINSKCNNDTEPYRVWNCIMLTNFLQENGEAATHIEILRAYEEGNFQRSGGENKYTKALRALYLMPEYASFDWRRSNYDKDCPIQAARKSDLYKDILKKALFTKLETGKYLLKKSYEEEIPFVYCSKYTKRGIIWTMNKAKARIFKYMDDLQRIKKQFNNGDSFLIESI